MKTYSWLKADLPSNRSADILGVVRPVVMIVLLIVLFVAPVSAETIVLTLDDHTVPAGLQCGEIWNEAGLNLIMVPHPPLCFTVELCDFFSNPDHLAFSPAILEVDLTGVEGTVTSAVVFGGSLCTCVKVAFYNGTSAVDSLWGGGFTDTLVVFTSGMPVDRLAVEGCYSTTVSEIQIHFDPTTTGIGQTDHTPGVPLEARPNPFSAATRISFDLETDGRAELRVYDVSGRAVRSLLDAELPAGRRTAAWDGLDASGRRLPPGVYFVRLSVNGQVTRAGKVMITR